MAHKPIQISKNPAPQNPGSPQAKARRNRGFLKSGWSWALLAVVVVFLVVFAALALAGRRASSVTPAPLRTSDQITVTCTADGNQPLTFNTIQRDQLLKILRGIHVHPDGSRSLPTSSSDVYRFCGIGEGEDGWEFMITSDGWLFTGSQSYRCISPDAEQIWSQLEALAQEAQ
jgi:hypothetical protein